MTTSDTWDNALQELRARWPEVQLEHTAYARCVDALGAAPKDGHRRLELALTCACLHGDSAALRALEQEFILPARIAVARVHHAPEFVADVMQQLRTKLLTGETPRLKNYRAVGPLAAFVRMVATRLALDQVK